MSHILRFTTAVLATSYINIAAATPYFINDISALQGTYGTTPVAINNSGTIVGLLNTAQGNRSFLYSDGVTQVLPRLPDALSGSDGAESINSVGQIVGQSGERAYLYSNGATISLGAPAGRSTAYPFSLNDNGQIVGYSVGAGSDTAFLYGEGVFQNLAGLSHAFAINNVGQIVGDSYAQAALYSGGNVQILGQLPGGRSGSRAVAINEGGQIVGSSDSADGWQAFLYADGEMRALLPEGGRVSQANSINNLGQVVGVAGFIGGLAAFLFDGDEVVQLSELVTNLGDWRLDTAYDINDRGQIVGTGWRDGQQRAFLLSPVNEIPTPSTLLLVLPALILLVCVRSKRSTTEA